MDRLERDVLGEPPEGLGSTAYDAWREGWLAGCAALAYHDLEEGSIVVLRGQGIDESAQEVLADALAVACGHRQFVIVQLRPDTSLDVVHDPRTLAHLLGLADI